MPGPVEHTARALAEAALDFLESDVPDDTRERQVAALSRHLAGILRRGVRRPGRKSKVGLKDGVVAVRPRADRVSWEPV